MNNVDIVRWDIKNGFDRLWPTTKLKIQVLGICDDDLKYRAIYQNIPSKDGRLPVTIMHENFGEESKESRLQRVEKLIKPSIRYPGMAKNKLTLRDNIDKMDFVRVFDRNSHDMRHVCRYGTREIISCLLDNNSGFFEWYNNFDPTRVGQTLRAFIRARDTLANVPGRGMCVLPAGAFDACAKDVLAFAYEQRDRWFRDKLHRYIIMRMIDAQFTK